MFTVLDLKVSSFLMLMNAIIRGKFQHCEIGYISHTSQEPL